MTIEESRSILSCSGICVEFGTFVAIRDVSFTLNRGEYLCVVGANGSGKTTLVKTLLGLEKPTRGSVERYRTAIGYVSQKSAIQRDFPATVEEIVLSGTLVGGGRRPVEECGGRVGEARQGAGGGAGRGWTAKAHGGWHLFYTKADKETARAAMEQLGIVPLAKKPFKVLSGGQQQRVLLARALSAAGELLVLDEPVTGLDPVVTDELYQIIRELNTEKKLAVLMVSHDIHRAVQNATHILHLANEPLFFGTAVDYQKTPLYTEMTEVEVCETHLCTHCGANCNASHIPGFTFRKETAPAPAAVGAVPASGFTGGAAKAVPASPIAVPASPIAVPARESAPKEATP